MITIEKADNDSIMLLTNKISCAKQALRNPARDFTDAERDFFYKSTIDALGSYEWLYKEEWDRIIVKYNLDRTKVYTLREGNIYE